VTNFVRITSMPSGDGCSERLLEFEHGGQWSADDMYHFIYWFTNKKRFSIDDIQFGLDPTDVKRLQKIEPNLKTTTVTRSYFKSLFPKRRWQISKTS